MNDFEEVICADCGNKFPEDMINMGDEPLCEECYNERAVTRAEERMDLD